MSAIYRYKQPAQSDVLKRNFRLGMYGFTGNSLILGKKKATRRWLNR